MSSLLQHVVSALKEGKARLTGSRAEGSQHEDSDFDFYVASKHWKRFVKEAPTGWESVCPGHIGWRLPEGLVDVSKLFHKKASASRQPIEAFGVLWETY